MADDLNLPNPDVMPRPGAAPDAVVSLPGGKTISLAELKKIREAAITIDEKASTFLANPRVLLKRPRKDREYAWPVRDTRTAGLIRSNIYRTVKPSELREDTPYAVTVVGGADDGHVEWNNHILVEIDEAIYKSRFIAPLWQGTEQLAKLKELQQQNLERYNLQGVISVESEMTIGKE